MSFLTPLYIAGLAVVTLPILFHMIRRTPRGRVPFSTVRFLDASPPRVTRRSRIEHWPLLLMRALAVCLLAAAFARPFLRQTLGLDLAAGNGTTTAVLLDASASMRRDPLWNEAVARAFATVDAAGPHDEVALFVFDRTVRTLVDFDEWRQLQPAARRTLARRRLESVSPGWAGTHLGAALTAAAERIQSLQTAHAATRPREIQLITDLQAGSHVDDLSGYHWPPDLPVLVERVLPAGNVNAGIRLVTGTFADGMEKDGTIIRARVTNAADSNREQFRLRWETGTPATDNETVDVYVPAGQSRVVRAPERPATGGPLRLVLEGDDHPFDNALHVRPHVAERLTVLYLGDGSPDDPRQPRYYAERAFPDLPHRIVDVVAQSVAAPALSPDSDDVPLIIAADIPTEAQFVSLRRFAAAGGIVLLLGRDAEHVQSFGPLLEAPKLSARESAVEGYSMLADIDFAHPLFAPLASEQFADFTEIHIWKHRSVSAADIPNAEVLARFDDGDPAVIEQRVGRGRIVLLTFGWHPEESQLALSSKFVPLLNGLLELGSQRSRHAEHLTVGESLLLPRSVTEANTEQTGGWELQRPDDSRIQLTAAQKSFGETTLPGIYTLPEPLGASQFTVHLDPAESQTAPLPIERLESLGIVIAAENAAARTQTVREQQRQLLAAELEQRQKLWQWLIAAAVAVLMLETWWAGRLARATAVVKEGSK